jgi:hypothetical protein
MQVVERDLRNAALAGLSADRRFVTAYNAALQLPTVTLRAAGYRTSGTAHHWATFQALFFILEPGDTELADFFDSCRRKRNAADYDAAGRISEAEVQELLEEVGLFRKHVVDWLSREHPDLLKDES